MADMSLFNTRYEHLLKRCAVRIGLRVPTLFFDKLPYAFTPIRGESRDEYVEYLNSQGLGRRLHQRAPLLVRAAPTDGHREAR